MAETASSLCTTCLEEASLCLACGRPATGESFSFDGSGAYCEQCCLTRSPYNICNAPLTDSRWQLSDGRITCANCHTSAVYRADQAAEIYKEIIYVAREQLGFELSVPTGLALVDQDQMREVIRLQLVDIVDDRRGTSESSELDPGKTLGVYARRGMRRGIYIQTGLPRKLFLQVAAHEYAHAWQGENCPILHDRLLYEGFAEWVAYHVIGRFGYPDSQRMMKTREDIYGEGLKWALQVEAAQGVGSVIETCRSTR